MSVIKALPPQAFHAVSEEQFEDALEELGIFCDDYLGHDGLNAHGEDKAFVIYVGDLKAPGSFQPGATNLLVTGDLHCDLLEGTPTTGADGSTLNVGGDVHCGDPLLGFGVFLVVGGSLHVRDTGVVDYSDGCVVVEGDLRAAALLYGEIEVDVDGATVIERSEYAPGP
ncbi:MAG: hypothetical protein AAGF12_33480, partial [Myxococcota bacterium]